MNDDPKLRGYDTLDEALAAIAEYEETKRRMEISSRRKKLHLPSSNIKIEKFHNRVR